MADYVTLGYDKYGVFGAYVDGKRTNRLFGLEFGVPTEVKSTFDRIKKNCPLVSEFHLMPSSTRRVFDFIQNPSPFLENAKGFKSCWMQAKFINGGSTAWGCYYLTDSPVHLFKYDFVYEWVLEYDFEEVKRLLNTSFDSAPVFNEMDVFPRDYICLKINSSSRSIRFPRYNGIDISPVLLDDERTRYRGDDVYPRVLLADFLRIREEQPEIQEIHIIKSKTKGDVYQIGNPSGDWVNLEDYNYYWCRVKVKGILGDWCKSPTDKDYSDVTSEVYYNREFRSRLLGAAYDKRETAQTPVPITPGVKASEPNRKAAMEQLGKVALGDLPQGVPFECNGYSIAISKKTNTR